jgi:hypothetical protein
MAEPEPVTWTITSEADQAFRLVLADCDRAHAESVVQNLIGGPEHYLGLVLEDAGGHRSLYRWRRE